MTADIWTRRPAHLARRTAVTPYAPDGDDGEDPGAIARLAWASLAIALLTLLVVAGRSIAAGGEPIGDGALVTIGARDVLAGELPLVGAPVSALGDAGAHHPAPLLYDVLAVPVALFPGHTGLVVGATLVNVGAVLAVFLVVRRRGGPLLAIVATAEAMALGWAVGEAALVEPSPANVVVLPALAFMLLAWAVACGDIALLPWAAGVGSFVVGANLSYAVLVVSMTGFALVAAYLARRDRTVWLPLQTALITAVVLALAWAQPVYEQLFGGRGDGNLVRLGRAVGDLAGLPTVDWSAAVRVVARTLVLPPWWLRPSFGEIFEPVPFGETLPALGLAVVGIVFLAGEQVWFLRSGKRPRDRPAEAALVGALVLVAASLITADLTPVVPTARGDMAPAPRLQWLWPAGAFGAFAGVGAWLRLVVAKVPAWRTLVAGGTAAVALVLGALTIVDLPAMDVAGDAEDAGDRDESAEAVRDLRQALVEADLDGPLLVDCQERVVDLYCEAMMATLQRMGVGFVVPDTTQGVGGARLWERGDPARTRLTVVVGQDAEQPRADALLMAVHESRSDRHNVALFVGPI